MDLRDSPAEAVFRAELRVWIEANCPDELRSGGGARDQHAVEALSRRWLRALAGAGYAGLTWPVDCGGRGLSQVYGAILLEELAQAAAPPQIGLVGLNMCGPTLIAFGSEEQQRRHLPTLLTGEEIWCQGFSEPGAGSDLAALRTRADIRGDRIVLDGQKVWSSFAHAADFCLLLARSDPDSTGHRGLTMLILDMHAPGVDVRPIRQLTGEPEFNEIFLTGAEVPADNVIGTVGEGWQVAMTTLLHERGTLGVALTAALDYNVARLVELACLEDGDGHRAADDPLVRDRIARELVELAALRATNLRALANLVDSGVPGPEGSVVKLRWSEANRRVTTLGQELLGVDALLAGADAPLGAFWQYEQLRSLGNTIEAGTSEVLRGIVAERVLGLPRSR